MSLKNFKFLSVVLLLFAFITVGHTQVDVSTGGTPTTYANLKLAFDAINAGTHTGDILIEITGAGTYTDPSAPAILNSSGAGSANYTSILIRPSADGVSIFATQLGGRGVIELNGADNVTIDGDNPNTSGTNRNLTIYSNASATTTYTSVIRIATSAAAPYSDANNITIKNCIINGSAVGRNISTATSTTGSENTTFGIYAGGNGGATISAITSVTTNTSASGTTINNFIVDNNEINQCARALVFNGAAATVSNGVTITNNLIGGAGTLTGDPPYTSPANTVYTKGIWVAGTTAVTISGNTIQNVLSYVGTQMNGVELNTAIGSGTVNISNNSVIGVVNNGTSSGARGIDINSVLGAYTVSNNIVTNIQTRANITIMGMQLGGTATSGTVDLNKVTTVYCRGTGTYGSYGININGGNNLTIKNNFISDIQHDMTGGGAFSTTFGVFGLRVGAGTGHKIYHNSVNLFGAMPGTAAESQLSAAFCIVGTGQTGLDVRNNIFANTITGGTTSIAHVSIYLPSAGTSAMNLTLNNNAYYFGTDALRQGVGQGGTTAGTNFYLTLAALKAYSSTLSVPGTNDNASFASSSAAPFQTSTNLHIPAAIITELESGGASVGVTVDIDGDVRPGPAGSVNGGATAPDIGADEFDGTPLDLTPPVITYIPLLNTGSTSARTLVASITDPSGVPTSGIGLPVLYWKINTGGSWSGATATYLSGSNYQFSFGSGVTVGDTVFYYVVAQDNATTPNVGAFPSGGASGFTANPPAAATPPTNPSGYLVTQASLAGDYTVGVSMFNQITGKNIYFEKVVNKVMKEVWVANPQTESKDKNSPEAPVIFGDLNSGSYQMREVEEITWIPMENGLPYSGDLYIKKNENPELAFPEGIEGVYATITAAVADLNLRGVAGNVNFLLTDANYSSGETFPIIFNVTNENLPSSTKKVTIKPNTGVMATIAGNSATGIFVSFGVDYIIFDGSNSGGTDRSLTIENTSTATNSYVLGIFHNGVKGAQNNTIKNCVIKAGTISSTSWCIILNFSGGDYDNTVIQNNELLKANIGMQFVGVATGITNGGLISKNIFGSDTDSLSIGNRGMVLSYVDGLTVSENTIKNLKVGTNPTGIIISAGAVNSTISRNLITGIIYTGTGGYGGKGIDINTANTSSNLTIANNMLTNILGDGWSAFSSDAIVGIRILGTTGGINIYHNSINMYGSISRSGATADKSACLYIVGTASALDIRDNIFVNSIENTTGVATAYSIYSDAANTAFTNINYNDYYAFGLEGVLGYLGSNTTTLLEWQTATGQDANSISADPHFNSDVDLHINSAFNTVSNNGQYIAAVPTDFDGDARSVTTPDIGADEYIYVPPTVADPTGVSASAISDSQIDVAFTPNGSNNNVVIVFNLTGIFTPPVGPPPSPGDPFAGGTFLTSTTTSPYSHTGLTQVTTYYYKLFSYDGSNYSPGVTASATTQATPLSVPYTQNFNSSTFPPSWSQSAANWTVSNTANAGGAAYEMKSTWFSFTGVTRLIVGPINTTGLTALALEFKHFYDDYGTGITMKIQSSSDATTWTDEAFSFASGGGNIGPTTVNTVINNNVGSTTYIAFVQDGDHFQFDYWYIDNVSLTIPPANDVGTVSIDLSTLYSPGVISPKATIKNFGTNTQNFNVQMTADGGYSSTKTVTSLAPFTSQQVTFDDWSPVYGVYNVNVCTQLAGDLNTGNDCLSKYVSVIDTSGVWASGANYPTTTYLGTGVGHNGFLYSLGGNTTSALKTECYKYEVATDTWTQIASLPAGRVVLASAVVGDFIYAIGGSDGTNYQTTVYKYDIALNTWSTVAPLPVATGWCKAVGYNDKIYVAGGVLTGSILTNAVYVYDVTSNTWATATAMPGNKFGGGFSVTGNKLVYVAGADDLGISNTVYVGTIDNLDPTVIVWTTMATPYPGVNRQLYSEYGGSLTEFIANSEDRKIYAAEATAYPIGSMYRFDAAPWGDSEIIVAGGSPTAAWVPANPNPTYTYDPVTDTWTPKRTVPTPVLGSSLGTVNSGTDWKLILASGYTGATTSVVQIYSESLGAATFQLSVNVANGWNMVSVPGLHPVDQNVNTWWSGKDPAANVFRFQSGYQAVTSVQPGSGYWMKHLGANTYNTGDEWPAGGINIVPHDPINAASGWNLIGGYEFLAPTAALTTNPSGLISGFVYGYTPGSGYQVASDLVPGYGYWVKLTAAGQININPGPKANLKLADLIGENAGKIIITDNAGKSYTLYVANESKTSLDYFELPPVPFSDMFDVRYTSGRFVEELSSAIKTIQMQGVEYPVKVRVEGMMIRISDESGKVVNERIKSGEEVTISNPSVSKLNVMSDIIPDKYSLEQNYPNPFNPATTIEFTLPEDVENVRLTIYNALGEKVAELVNGKMEAGRYRYQWNAGNVATGLYIYELKTNKFSSAKKMILMK